MNVRVERGRVASLASVSHGSIAARYATVIRPFVIAGLVLVCVALQTTLLTDVRLFGVTPQLLLVALICFSLEEEPESAVVVGFGSGALMDLLLPGSILGLTALVYTLVTYTVASLYSSARGPRWLPIVVVGVGSLSAEVGYIVLSVLLGEPWLSLSDTARIVSWVGVYNVAITPLVFPVVTRLAVRIRSERVARFDGGVPG